MTAALYTVSGIAALLISKLMSTFVDKIRQSLHALFGMLIFGGLQRRETKAIKAKLLVFK